MNRQLTVNGFTYQAEYADALVEHTLLPLLFRLDVMQKRKGRRILVFLAAPPAVGKSTLVAFLAALGGERGIAVQGAGLDGFHFPNAYLRSHVRMPDGTVTALSPAENSGNTSALAGNEGRLFRRSNAALYAAAPAQGWNQRGDRLPGSDASPVCLAAIKGSPGTFDTGAFREKLRELMEGGPVRWPVYDRRKHEPLRDAALLAENIILIEGNWLLLAEEPWMEIRRTFADLAIFATADPEILRERLISRKMRGGSTRAAAETWYETTDGPNIRRVMEHSAEADITLRL